MENKNEISMNELLRCMNAFQLGTFVGKNGRAYTRVIAGDKRIFLDRQRVVKENGEEAWRWVKGSEVQSQAQPQDNVAVAA